MWRSPAEISRGTVLMNSAGFRRDPIEPHSLLPRHGCEPSIPAGPAINKKVDASHRKNLEPAKISFTLGPISSQQRLDESRRAHSTTTITKDTKLRTNSDTRTTTIAPLFNFHQSIFTIIMKDLKCHHSNLFTFKEPCSAAANDVTRKHTNLYD